MDTIKSVLTKLWNKDWTMKALIPTAILLLVSFLTGFPLAGLFFFIFAFSIFDVYGFGLTADRDADVSEKRLMYRTTQAMMQTFLIALVWSTCGFLAALASMIAWWFCVCDKVFYILKKEVDYGGIYTWLQTWSFFLVLKKFGVKPYTKEFNSVAIIGLILSIIICIVL